MYKILVIASHEVGRLEADLNSFAKEGFEFVYAFESNARQVIILKQKPKVGRKPKSEEEGE